MIFEFSKPQSIKGLSCIVDINDAIALGVKYCHENFYIDRLIDVNAINSEMFIEIDGQKIGVNKAYVEELDSRYKALTDGGISIIMVVLNEMPRNPVINSPFIHPDTDVVNCPNRLGAFNITSEIGLRYFRAAIEFVADRYTRPDRRYGLITGMIIGNELQQHWMWYNMGSAPADKVIHDYAIAVREAYLAAHKYHKRLDIFISMDQQWNMAVIGDPLKEIPGKTLLTKFNEVVRHEGDFPWGVAFHPYPDNLFEPRFWNDKNTTMDFNTPKITFRNIEILPSFMKQSQFLYNGKIRKIILSEQGFHTPDGPDGEKIQAACYAYAYYKISHIPEIGAFILHRHFDHPQEGGLRLGVWMHNSDAAKPEEWSLKKKFIWEVLKNVDTDEWQKTFEFAKPIIGIDDWNQTLSARVNCN